MGSEINAAAAALEEKLCGEYCCGENLGENDSWIVPFIPSSIRDIDDCLRILGVSYSCSLIDIGCGDGRVVCRAAASYGCRAAGFDLSNECVALAKKRAENEGVSHLVDFSVADFAQAAFWERDDVCGANCVFLYIDERALGVCKAGIEGLIRRGAKVTTLVYHFDGIGKASSFRDGKIVLYHR